MAESSKKPAVKRIVMAGKIGPMFAQEDWKRMSRLPYYRKVVGKAKVDYSIEGQKGVRNANIVNELAPYPSLKTLHTFENNEK